MANPNPPSQAAADLLERMTGRGATTKPTTTGGGVTTASGNVAPKGAPTTRAEALYQQLVGPSAAVPETFASGQPGAMALPTYQLPAAAASVPAGVANAFGLTNPVNPEGVAQGIDIAQVNEIWNPALAQHREDFAIFKVSEGIAPYQFGNFYQSAQEAKTPLLGAYHFIRPEWSTSGQVRAFLNQVQGKNFGFYAVDVEDTKLNKVTPALADQARSFIQEVSQATGKPVLLYTNESVLREFFNKPGDQNLPLWISSPNPTLPQARPDIGTRPYLIWQNSITAPAAEWGTQTNPKPETIPYQVVDVNRAAGSLPDLLAGLSTVAQQQAQLYPR